MEYRKTDSTGAASETIKEKAGKLLKYKYPLLVLAIGAALMLLPTGQVTAYSAKDADVRMQKVLSATEGVGSAQVIISDSGVVVVCGGADDAKVRLEIIQAVSSYTGFGADKITVLKMAD